MIGVSSSGSACKAHKREDSSALAPRVEPATPASVAARLGIDAAVFVDAVDTMDPPAPPGDLKEELERFVNLDICVKEKARLDPLVGDALRAIGYDTFLRDACRLLEAAKDPTHERCDSIDSSGMRVECKKWVAMISRVPAACPLDFEGLEARGRAVTCVAVASDDPRLCASERSLEPRATCDALTSRDDAKCAVLYGDRRAACAREVSRWRSLLLATLRSPLKPLPKLTATRGTLTVKSADGEMKETGDAGTLAPVVLHADVASEVAQGAVVVTSRDRARVELGMRGESTLSRVAHSPSGSTRLGIALVMEPNAIAKEPPKPVLERLELAIPGESTVVYPPATCDCRLTHVHVDRARGGEVSLLLEGTLSQGNRSYSIQLNLATFVRDVVEEGPDSHVLAPVHPLIKPGTTPAVGPGLKLQ